MRSVTLADIVVEGISYRKLMNISMTQMIGNHAKCVFSVEMADESFNPMSATNITVRVKVLRHPEISYLFMGTVVECKRIAEQDYPGFQFEALSMSYLLDIVPKTATYQQKTKTFKTLMTEVAEGKANIFFGVTDRQIGSWMYQNNETAWQFIQRLASNCQACVMTNPNTSTPIIYIGKTGKVHNEPIIKTQTYRMNGKTVYRTYSILMLGEEIPQGGCVAFANTFNNGGELVTDFILDRETAFQRSVYYNESTSCTMLTGKVVAVEKEKVKVHFESIDQEQDSASDSWFEYATPYATGGGPYGSAFYCMPEEGDQVRVFIPSADESKAFAFGTVVTDQTGDPMQSVWKMPMGQEILFTSNGIRISSGEEYFYIDMTKNSGIQVWSSGIIGIDGGRNVELSSKDSIIIYGENDVDIKSSENEIVLQNDKIVFNANNIHMD